MDTRPSYYKGKTLEAINVIRDFDLGFNLGNVVKYVLRAGRKPDTDRTSDLAKAAQYLAFELGTDTTSAPDFTKMKDGQVVDEVLRLAERSCHVAEHFAGRDELVLALKALGLGDRLK